MLHTYNIYIYIYMWLIIYIYIYIYTHTYKCLPLQVLGTAVGNSVACYLIQDASII